MVKLEIEHPELYDGFHIYLKVNEPSIKLSLEEDGKDIVVKAKSLSGDISIAAFRIENQTLVCILQPTRKSVRDSIITLCTNGTWGTWI